MTSKKQTTTRHDLVANQIFEKAAALFAERGFASTSLKDIAEAMDISRSALYYYISSKDELVNALVKGISAQTAADLEALASDHESPVDQRVETAIRTMVERIAESPARFRLLLVSEGSLPEGIAKTHRQARRATLEHLTALIQEAMDKGVFRPASPALAAFAVLGMCNWVAWWYRPEMPFGSPQTVAGDLANLALAGLLAEADGEPVGGNGLQQALHRMRRDLAFIERGMSDAGSQGHGAA